MNITPRTAGRILAFALVTGVCACGGGSRSAAGATPGPTPGPTPSAEACAPGGAVVEYSGHAVPDEARTYRMLPFAVAPGSGRVELS